MNASENSHVPFTLSLFGASEVKIQGIPIAIKPKKAKWVLMLLALAGSEGRSLSRAELSKVLWPWRGGDEYPVHRIIEDLRQVLKEEAYRIQKPEAHKLKLDLTGASVDVLRFRELLAEMVASGDPTPLLNEPQLRPGQLMTDFPEGEPTIEPERAKLRHLFVKSLDLVVEKGKIDERWQAVTSALMLILTDNPLPDEPRTLLVVEAYNRNGDYGQAQSAFEAFVRKGGKPSRELTKIAAQWNVSSAVKESASPYSVSFDKEAGNGTALRQELTQLVASSSDKGKLKWFLSEHPHLLVGSDHVLSGTVLTDFSLQGNLAVDFAYIDPQSGRSYLYLIYLSDPRHSIFTAKDEFTADFNRAYEHLEACILWIGQNQLYLPRLFETLYEESTGAFPGFLLPRCKLVIGRRAELSSIHRKEKFAAKCGIKDGPLELRTYDGFLEEIAPTIEVDPKNQRGIRSRKW